MAKEKKIDLKDCTLEEQAEYEMLLRKAQPLKSKMATLVNDKAVAEKNLADAKAGIDKVNAEYKEIQEKLAKYSTDNVVFFKTPDTMRRF